MSVIQSTVTRPKPGRRHDAVALGVEAAKLLERHGAANNRLLLGQPAGEATGSHVHARKAAGVSTRFAGTLWE